MSKQQKCLLVIYAATVEFVQEEQPTVRTNMLPKKLVHRELQTSVMQQAEVDLELEEEIVVVVVDLHLHLLVEVIVQFVPQPMPVNVFVDLLLGV